MSLRRMMPIDRLTLKGENHKAIAPNKELQATKECLEWEKYSSPGRGYQLVFQYQMVSPGSTRTRVRAHTHKDSKALFLTSL